MSTFSTYNSIPVFVRLEWKWLWDLLLLKHFHKLLFIYSFIFNFSTKCRRYIHQNRKSEFESFCSSEIMCRFTAAGIALQINCELNHRIISNFWTVANEIQNCYSNPKTRYSMWHKLRNEIKRKNLENFNGSLPSRRITKIIHSVNGCGVYL